MAKANGSYRAKEFNLSGLTGISDKTLETHFKLYEGYVKETNRLNEKISELIQGGKVDREEMPAYSELTRRLGFEYNGMALHALRKPRNRRSGAMRRGKRSSSASGRCAGSAGRSATRIPRTAGSRTTGSRCTRSATWPASVRFL